MGSWYRISVQEDNHSDLTCQEPSLERRKNKNGIDAIAVPSLSSIFDERLDEKETRTYIHTHTLSLSPVVSKNRARNLSGEKQDNNGGYFRRAHSNIKSSNLFWWDGMEKKKQRKNRQSKRIISTCFFEY